MIVQFVLIHEDNWWSQETYDCPDITDPEVDNDRLAVSWWDKTHGGTPANRNVLMVAVYSYNPEEGK
jgi:hypothetical protein